MRTLKNILLGTAVCLLNVAVVHAQTGNGWSIAGPKNIAGRILAIHVDVNNSQRLYAGSAGGGLWISPNQGISWSRSTGFDGSAAVSAIAQSSDGTLYVGTGEGLNYGGREPGVLTNTSHYGIMGDGIYKSTDKGATFTLLSGTETWIEVNGMAYDNVHNKLYAATNEGLKISSDGGNSFVSANIPPVKGVNVSVGNDGTVLYSEEGNAYVSTDAGVTFNSVCGAAPKLPSAGGYITVDIAPSDPNIMYAMVSQYGNSRGVYVSIDKGNTWRVIFPISEYEDPLYGWGTYCNVLKVPPTEPTWVLAGGARLYLGKEWDSKEYYSWTDNVKNPLPYVQCIAFDGNLAFIGTNTGVRISDIKQGIQYYGERNNNLGTMQAYTLGVANDGRLMIGARDNGTVFVERPNDDAKSGKNIAPIDKKYEEPIYRTGGGCVFSYIKPEALFYAGVYGSCYRRASAFSDPQEPSGWYGATEKNTIIMLKEAQNTRWYIGDNINSIVTPLIMWESVNDVNSIDSVRFIADKTYVKGDIICAKSKRNNYPIWMEYTGEDTLKRNADTIYVQDIVTSRLFMGGGGYKLSSTAGMGAPVFMTTSALDFINHTEWICVFRTKDTADQVMDLAVSKDGNHLFVLVKNARSSSPDYSIYRVSGFDYYRAPIDIDVSSFNYEQIGTPSFEKDNINRKLVDDLVLKYDRDDVLGISLDPNDNNTLVFVTNGPGWGDKSRIFAVTDALTATDGLANYESKEGTGIPQDIVAYSAIVVMKKDDNSSNIAYIGTEKGIYVTKDFTFTSPKWEPYNQGIFVKTPVFRLFQQTNSFPDTKSVTYDAQGIPNEIAYSGVSNYRKIYAATHGLGVFVDNTYWDNIPKLDPTIVNPNKMEVRVFPNPATSLVTIDFILANSDNVSVELTDLVGRTVMTKQLGYRMIGAYQEMLDCSSLMPGFYFISVKAGYKVRTAKIIIEK